MTGKSESALLVCYYRNICLYFQDVVFAGAPKKLKAGVAGISYDICNIALHKVNPAKILSLSARSGVG